MMGLGTGLAPFRGFCEEREAILKEGGKLGPVALYYGCRHHDKDYLCEKDLAKWKDMGVLTELQVGFSHDALPKMVFLNEEVKANPEPAWNSIKHDGTEIYYCGLAMGIPQKMLEAFKASAVKAGGMSPEEADAYMEAIDTDGEDTRFHAECF
jgi:NADPH-ferrihemoprotein reductase